jgi:hypothetical protein
MQSGHDRCLFYCYAECQLYLKTHFKLIIFFYYLLYLFSEADFVNGIQM